MEPASNQSRQGSKANRRETARAIAVLHSRLAEALRTGFYGLARIELVIADGTIQGLRT